MLAPGLMELLGALVAAVVRCRSALCPRSEATIGYLPSVGLGGRRLDARGGLTGHGGGLGGRLGHRKPFNDDVAQIGNR